MQKVFPALLLMGILVLGSVVPSNFAFAQSDKVNVLIGFDGKPDVSLVNQHGGSVRDNFHPFINVVSAELPSNAVQGLQNNPKISYIEPDLIATIHNHTAGNDYAKVWGVDHIDADMVHPDPSGNGVNVVVIDTGIDYSHHAIGNYVGGIDFVNNDNDPMDDHGHGTHVSGTISGDITNSEIIGVSYDVNLYGVKVLSASGSGSYANVINGIKWAADNGMDIANLSLGGGSSTSLCNAVTEAYNSGVLIIASAGNSGNPKGKGTNTGYPATCLDAIAVAATTSTDSRASFSSTGPAVEISAPGSGIYSSVLGGSYATWSGTSMAAPHVSGVAALVKDANPTLTPQKIRTILQDTALPLDDDPARDNLYGFGLVDAPDAVAEAVSYTGSNPISPTPDFTITASPNSFSVNVGEFASSTITVNALDGFTDSINLSTDNGSLNPTSVSLSESQSGTSQLSLDTSTVGTFTVTITGTNGTLPHSTTINLTVNSQTSSPAENFNSEIVLDVENKRKFNNLLVTVIATDNDNSSSLLSNIPIQLTLSRGDAASWNYAGTTDESGSISFKLMKARSGEVYTATITNWDSVFSTGDVSHCGHIDSKNNWVPCSP